MPKGQGDLSAVIISQHALDRFIERFCHDQLHDPNAAEASLRRSLGRTRALGRNRANGATAVLAVHHGRILVAILQNHVCTTVLTWPQFEPRLREFGRTRLPRKRGRMLRRLVEPE